MEPARSRAKRLWARLGVAALVLALFAVGGLAAVLYTADAEFVAGALSRVLGRRVDVGAVAIRLGSRLELELRQVRVADPSRPDGPPLLEIEQARGFQAWPRLLAGQLLPVDWEMQRPVLRLHAPAKGAEGDGTAFDLASLPRIGLAVQDGAVEYQPAAGEAYALRGLQLGAKRAAFGLRIEGEASARVVRGERAIGELALRYSSGRTSSELDGTLAGVDLAALPQDALGLAGRASGRYRLELEHDDGALSGELDLQVAKLSARRPELSAPIAPRLARCALDLRWANEVLTLELRPLVLDDVVATGSVVLDTGTPGRVALDLALAPFEPGARDRLTPLSLLGLRFDTWRRVAEQIDAGRIDDARVRIDVPRVGGGELLSFERPVPESAFEVALRASDGIYRPSEGTRLEEMSGTLSIRGNVLEIGALRLRDGESRPPAIGVRIDGMHRLVNLPDDENDVDGGPGHALSGLSAALDGLRGDDPEREPTVVRFADLALRYPAFVLPLRAASGELRFRDGGLETDGVRGLLGGAPAQLAVNWQPAQDTLDVDIRYEDGEREGPPASGPVWLDGRVELDALAIGDLRFEALASRLRAEGTRVDFEGLTAMLSQGALRGSGRIELGEAERAPYRFELEVQGFDPEPIVHVFGLPEHSITGRGNAKGYVSGALRRDGRFATEGELEVALALSKGTVAELPVLVALARLPSLQGVTSLLGRPLPYDEITAGVSLANGRVALADGKLLGPELRILSSGEVDLNTPQRESDFVTALLFLQTLDRVLGTLPIVRNVMLGDNRNLLALYFRLQGPRDELRVTPLPPETVRNVVGFASDAVMKGVRGLGKLIPLGRDESAATPDPSPATP